MTYGTSNITVLMYYYYVRAHVSIICRLIIKKVRDIFAKLQ
jgi:hypothetical protein